MVSSENPSSAAIAANECRSVCTVTSFSPARARRRLNLLPRWTSRFDWLKDIKKEVDVVVVLSEAGRLRLTSWEPDGPRLLQLHERLSEDDASDENFEALRLIQDRFERLKIDKEHRPYLGDAALAHLGLPLERGV